MGPLVPDLITNELNLVVALLLGIAFGFILEQAGFSSSRKLTGLFYGTDFTVLRVFFTAGTTAMTGVLLLSKLGLLDASVIYVNPTFVYSAMLGGVIMGIGFVVGGYCPGTSFCGAAVGRLDAMAFVGGGLIGAFGFGEMFPRVQPLYLGWSLGDLTVPSVLGISAGTFAVVLIVVAIGAFAVTTRIELRVNSSSSAHAFSVRRHRAAGAALLASGVLVAALPDYQAKLLAKAGDPDYQRAHGIARITADELAFRILDRDPALSLIDVRPAESFAKTGLPGAVNLRASDMFGKTWSDVLAQGRTRKVFIADDEQEATTAATLALLLGYRNVAVLAGGFGEFTRTILAAQSTASPGDVDDEVVRFRVDAAVRIAALVEGRRATKPTGRPVKKITGGCGV